jgi:hypothetical protein
MSDLREIDQLGDEIAEVAGHLNAGAHRLLSLIRAFDACGGWAAHGALSCAHWLSWRIGDGAGAAREKVRVARCLGDLPAIDGAFRNGELSFSQVRAMTRVATPENEARVLEMARSATAAQLEKLLRRYRNVVRPEGGAAQQDRYVRSIDTDDGMVRIEAKLMREEAAVVCKSIEAARAILRSGAGEQPARAGAGVSADSAEASRRLTCDCAHYRVTEKPDGTSLDIGRRTRSIATPIRRALRLRDGGCRLGDARTASMSMDTISGTGRTEARPRSEPLSPVPPSPRDDPRRRLLGRSSRGWLARVPPSGRAGDPRSASAGADCGGGPGHRGGLESRCGSRD